MEKTIAWMGAALAAMLVLGWGCASAPPTETGYVPYPQVVGVPRDSVDIVPQARLLASARGLARSRPDPSSKAQAALLLEVEREVSLLPALGINVAPDGEHVDATLRCDLRCHSQASRAGLIPMPCGGAGAMCVETILQDTRSGDEVARFEQWGRFRDGVPGSSERELRAYLIRKSLAELLPEIDRYNKAGLLPKPTD